MNNSNFVSAILLFSCITQYSFFSYAQDAALEEEDLSAESVEAPAPSPTPANKQYEIQYGSHEWNISSKSLDSAYMFIREKNQNRVAKILMEETEPDSSVFKGKYSIDWKDADPNSLEVYVPPKAIRKDEKSLKGFSTQITSNKLTAQPLIVKDSESKRLLDVYDSEESLQKAKEAYEMQKKAEAEVERLKLVQAEVLKKRVLETAEAQHRAKMAQLAAEAAVREAERLRLAELEKQKREENIKNSMKLAAAERLKRQIDAQKLADKGKALYESGDYAGAETAFKEATEHDPENNSFYFMYGVTLYRLDKFNEALIVLNMAVDGADNDLERQYYIALIHYRQKELAAAAKLFEPIKAAKNPEISPSAAFYQGLAQFALERLEPAKKNFEWVVDNADDPKLAAQAESYIERVAKAIQYKKLQERKWRFIGKVGGIYDSNILYAPDADETAGSSSDEGGLRLFGQGEVERRLMLKENSDLAVKWNSYYMYSIDDIFSVQDPWTNTISLPYNFKSMIKNKSTQWNITPGFESILMDSNEDGTREAILSTPYVSAEVTFINNDTWFSTYSFEYRLEDSLLPSSTGDEDADSNKFSLRTYQTKLLDSTKKRALIGNLGFVMNDTKGAEPRYNRYELGAIYTSPFKKVKNTSWTAALSFYRQDFFDSVDGREDSNVTLTYNVTKAYNESWSGVYGGTYTSNISSVEDSQYTKYIINATAVYTWVE